MPIVAARAIAVVGGQVEQDRPIGGEALRELDKPVAIRVLRERRRMRFGSAVGETVDMWTWTMFGSSPAALIATVILPLSSS
jgi:hypothetical protein